MCAAPVRGQVDLVDAHITSKPPPEAGPPSPPKKASLKDPSVSPKVPGARKSLESRASVKPGPAESSDVEPGSVESSAAHVESVNPGPAEGAELKLGTAESSVAHVESVKPGPARAARRSPVLRTWRA